MTLGTRSRVGAIDVALDPGLRDASGGRHRRARLRAVTGHDEDLASGLGGFAAGGYPQPQEVDELLAALLERLGGYQQVSPDLVASLTRADRDRLALAVRASLGGDEIRIVARCPNPDCGELMEVLLSTVELLAAVPDNPSSGWTSVVTTEGVFQVRLPRGSDDAAVAQLVSAQRLQGLWARIASPTPGPAAAAADLAAALAGLAEAAAAPDLMRVSRCPQCAAWLELDPDPVDLLARALRQGAARLLAEVHCLAFHYGWSQAEILALPRERRAHYLDLLRRQLEGRPLEDSWVVRTA